MEESSNRGGHVVYLRDVKLKYSDKPFFRPFRYSVADQDRYRELNPHIKLVDTSAIRRARRGPAHEELKRQWRQKINPNCNAGNNNLLKRPREDLGNSTETSFENLNLEEANPSTAFVDIPKTE